MMNLEQKRREVHKDMLDIITLQHYIPDACDEN